MAYDRSMPKVSAGLLMYRRRGGVLEVLLVHPGGPFFAGKDEGAWSIPKGVVDEGEDPLTAARRELREETGVSAQGPFEPLTPIRQKSGKLVHAWAFEGDAEPGTFRSNTFEMEWPRGSGRTIEVPEVDRSEWFDLRTAAAKANPAQRALFDELERKLGAG
jgi:predicted NUDIX family NTP pyrophosphohydrolase